MRETDWEELRAAAFEARDAAYAPYSGFAVGAALRTEQGRVFRGCNVENASFGATMCAERNALGAAVAAGGKALVALAIATDADQPTPPCGVCRQVLLELAPALEVRSFTKNGDSRMHTIASLLPDAFDRSQLE